MNEGVPNPRNLVRKAFSYMRVECGFYARMNYRCCRSCAVAALQMTMDRWNDWIVKPNAVVFFTGADMREADKDGILRISYGDTRLQNATRPFDTNVGKSVKEIFNRIGLECQWDGDPDKRIVVPVPNWSKKFNRKP